jgi:PPOX class probable F420-dependent enzyme
MTIPASDTIRDFLAAQPVGTIATRRPDGHARHTLVYYLLDDDRILISTEGKRGKARDVERDGWASFCVFAHEKPFASVTVEGPARVLREGISEPTARIVERIRGVRPETAPSDAQLAAADRVILEIAIERVYGASWIPGASGS